MKNTYFITVSENVITGSFYGDLNAELIGYESHEKIEVSAETSVNIGDPVTFYNDWQRKTDKQLLDEGLVTVPEGHVLDGDYIREMSFDEKNPLPEPTAEELAAQEAYQQIYEAEAAMQALTEAAWPQILALLDNNTTANARTRSISLKEQYENLIQQRNEAKAKLEAK